MPNHVHAIILLYEFEKSSDNAPTLGNIVGSYKAGATRIARRMKLIEKTQILWQGSYHDYIIRKEKSLNRFV